MTGVFQGFFLHGMDMRLLLDLYSSLGILRIITIADEIHAALFRDLLLDKFHSRDA
jgi:hypothetical protein